MNGKQQDYEQVTRQQYHQHLKADQRHQATLKLLKKIGLFTRLITDKAVQVIHYLAVKIADQTKNQGSPNDEYVPRQRLRTRPKGNEELLRSRHESKSDQAAKITRLKRCLDLVSIVLIVMVISAYLALFFAG